MLGLLSVCVCVCVGGGGGVGGGEGKESWEEVHVCSLGVKNCPDEVKKCDN